MIIKNAIIITLNSKFDIIENGSIVIKDTDIIAIGKTEDIEKQFVAHKKICADNKIVMPGLVNTHNHLSMTMFRGLADDIELQAWLNKYMFPAEAKFVTEETVKLGAEIAMVEMLHAGTTTFNDMYYYEEQVAEVAKKIGMRGIVAESFIDFPVPNSATPDVTEKHTRYLYEKYKNDPLITVGVAVHAPYTCSEELLKRGAKLAEQLDINYHIHIAETKWEYDLIKKKHNLTPVEYLDKLGVLNENVVSAHSVWLDDQDIDIYARRKVGVAHNPECNMKLASGVAPIPKMIDKQIKVGLGTDGAASNNNLNMFAEMQVMALIHKLWNKNTTVIPARTALRIATLGSAEVLRLDKKIGSLETGKKADIIMLDISKANTIPIYDYYSAIVYAFNAAHVTDVIINGQEVMRNDIILNIDEKDIKNKMNDLARKISTAIKIVSSQ